MGGRLPHAMKQKKWPIYPPIYPSLFFHNFIDQSHTLRDTASALALGPFHSKEGETPRQAAGKALTPHDSTVVLNPRLYL